MRGVEALSRQGEETQEYLAYSEFSKRSQVRCFGAKNVKLFLREPLDHCALMFALSAVLSQLLSGARDR